MTENNKNTAKISCVLRYYAKYFKCVISVNIQNTLYPKYCQLHFTNDKSETQES